MLEKKLDNLFEEIKQLIKENNELKKENKTLKLLIKDLYDELNKRESKRIIIDILV